MQAKFRVPRSGRLCNPRKEQGEKDSLNLTGTVGKYQRIEEMSSKEDNKLSESKELVLEIIRETGEKHYLNRFCRDPKIQVRRHPAFS